METTLEDKISADVHEVMSEMKSEELSALVKAVNDYVGLRGITKKPGDIVPFFILLQAILRVPNKEFLEASERLYAINIAVDNPNLLIRAILEGTLKGGGLH